MNTEVSTFNLRKHKPHLLNKSPVVGKLYLKQNTGLLSHRQNPDQPDFLENQILDYLTQMKPVVISSS